MAFVMIALDNLNKLIKDLIGTRVLQENLKLRTSCLNLISQLVSVATSVAVLSLSTTTDWLEEDIRKLADLLKQDLNGFEENRVTEKELRQLIKQRGGQIRDVRVKVMDLKKTVGGASKGPCQTRRA